MAKENFQPNVHNKVGEFLHENRSGIIEGIARSTEDLREGSSDTLPINLRPTELDIYGLDTATLKESGAEGLLRWVEKVTEIPFDDLNKDGKTEQSKEAYEKLNKAYQNAKDFLRGTLKYESGEVFLVNLRKIEGKEDLLYLLKNIKSVQEITDGEADETSRIHCRLAKATIAAFELRKHDYDVLKGITEHFESELLSPEKGILTFKGSIPDQGTQFEVRDLSDAPIKALLSARPKKERGAILRFINDPKANAEEALADGTGARIEIERKNKQEMRMVLILCKWLIQEMKIGVPIIENGKYLRKEEREELQTMLNAADIPFTMIENEPNTNSDDFRVLKIIGHLNFSDENQSIIIRDKKGKVRPTQAISAHARQFEIQIVDPDDENEKGPKSHATYNVKKYVAARTRLDGWCPKSVFGDFVEKAADKTGEGAEIIKGYVIGRDEVPKGEELKGKAAIVEIGKGDKARYVSYGVYERWKNLGIVSERRFKKIKEARKNTTGPVKKPLADSRSRNK
jgi:hypothetical protein